MQRIASELSANMKAHYKAHGRDQVEVYKGKQEDWDQPVNTLSGYGLRFVWLDDPDGITNYFAEIPATPSKKQ